MAVTYTASQEGTYNATGPAWVGTAASISSTGPTHGGLQFTVPVQTDQGRTVVPGQTVTAAEARVVDPPVFRSLTLQIEVLVAATGTITVSYRQEAQPSSFGVGNAPNSGNLLEVATFDAAGTGTVSVPLVLPADAWRSSQWRGVLAFALEDEAGVGFAAPGWVANPAVTLLADQIGQETGLSGPWQAQGRADQCPKCGFTSTRDNWLQDGYTSYYVCAKCWDPEDLVGRSRKPGREREGVNEGG